MEPSLIIVGVIALVLAAALFPLIFHVLKVQSRNGRLESERAEIQQRLEAEVAAQSADASDATELRVKAATLETELAAKDDLLKTSSASLEEQEQRREELQASIQKLTASEAQLTEELKNERKALTAAKESLDSTSSERDELRTDLEQSRIRVGKIDADLEAAREQLVKRKQDEESLKAWLEVRTTAETKKLREDADAAGKEREAAVKKLVEPLTQKVDALEKARERGQGMLQAQIETLVKSNSELSNQAQTLSSALTYKPQVRGQWGELNVERVLQLAGLEKGKHYETQATDASGQRPDFVVHLPHNRDIILDSKMSLNAYMDAHRSENDTEREAHLGRHARAMRGHADDLAKKDYPSSNRSAADFVVMVVPDFALQPATERDHLLVDRAAENQVLICGYSTLHALLKCVAMGWQERTIADEALEVQRLARELHDRLAVFAGHLDGVGKGLETAIDRYNKGVGSFDSRVMTQARRFREKGVGSTTEIQDVRTIDVSARSLKTLPATLSEPEPDDNGTALNGETNRVALPDEDQRTPDAALL